MTLMKRLGILSFFMGFCQRDSQQAGSKHSKDGQSHLGWKMQGPNHADRQYQNKTINQHIDIARSHPKLDKVEAMAFLQWIPCFMHRNTLKYYDDRIDEGVKRP